MRSLRRNRATVLLVVVPAAASALGMIGRPEGVPSLIAALKNKDANVRNLAAVCLRHRRTSAISPVKCVAAVADGLGVSRR